MNSKDSTDHPDVIAWPPRIFFGCVVVGTILHFMFPIRVMRYPVSLSLGVLLAAFSASLAIWAERTMKAAGTNVRPDRPTLTIVRSGPYRFTRNPMYLSLCLLQVTLGFILDGWIPVLFALVLMAILHFGVILREEKYLEASLFHRLSDAERHRLCELTKDLHTVQDVIAAFGEPDARSPHHVTVITPEKEGVPETTQSYPVMTYTKLSDQADVHVTIYPPDKAGITFQGKPMLIKQTHERHLVPNATTPEPQPSDRHEQEIRCLLRRAKRSRRISQRSVQRSWQFASLCWCSDGGIFPVRRIGAVERSVGIHFSEFHFQVLRAGIGIDGRSGDAEVLRLHNISRSHTKSPIQAQFGQPEVRRGLPTDLRSWSLRQIAPPPT